MMNASRRTRRGYSLIEMLVVISCLGVVLLLTASLIHQTILDKQMPPLGVFDTGVTRPPEPEVEKLKRWIAQGAPEVEVRPDVAGAEPDPLVSDQDRQFWAFRSPRPVAARSVKLP